MKKIIIIPIILIMFFSIFNFAWAQNNNTNSSGPIDINLIDKTGAGAGYSETAGQTSTVANTIGRIIQILLSFVGTIFFIYIIYSGLQWMTAGGNEEKVEKARTRIINATIGLAITVAAYFITWFISNALLTA